MGASAAAARPPSRCARLVRATVNGDAVAELWPTCRERFWSGDWAIPIAALVDSGVRVHVLTNSLASNDVIQAFAGYSLTRAGLLQAGVELRELRWEPGPARKRQLPTGSHAGLHTKTIVFDRKDVFVGSFNLDARSSAINTEAGLYVESPDLARQVIEYLDEGAGPEVSWRVQLDANERLFWTASDNRRPLRFDVDPQSTPDQRFKARFWSLLPILEQL